MSIEIQFCSKSIIVKRDLGYKVLVWGNNKQQSSFLIILTVFNILIVVHITDLVTWDVLIGRNPIDSKHCMNNNSKLQPKWENLKAFKAHCLNTITINWRKKTELSLTWNKTVSLIKVFEWHLIIVLKCLLRPLRMLLLKIR